MDIDNTFESDPCEQWGTHIPLTPRLEIGIFEDETDDQIKEGQVVGEDEDDFGTQGRAVRKKVEKPRQKFSKVYKGAKAYRLFVQAYQLVIWKQCYALIHEKGLPPELWTIVRDLWALRLSKLVHRLESPERVGSESQVLSSAEGSEQEGGPETLKTDGKGIESPKLVETIALCYMGMLLLRLPIGLGTVYRWIKEEDVLYIRAIRGVPMEMREKLPGEYHSVLDTTVMLQPEELHFAISDLATMYHRAFGLALPPLNYEVMLYKYILHLALPLEVFPAVQRLARAIRTTFHYCLPKESRRRRGSSFPELQLMSLVVIAVKLFHPFDHVHRHARSVHEPAAQTMDWRAWTQRRQKSAKGSSEAGLARGSEIDVCDTDVFNMDHQELDSYMDWYQKTWVREPRAGSDDNVNKAILDMFPLRKMESNVRRPSSQREQDLEEVAIQNTRATVASMKFPMPLIEEDMSDEEREIKRPGEDYRPCLTEAELSERAKAFFAAASETACTSIANLLLAVRQTEAKMGKWKTAKRRAEVTGKEFDLDAEMGVGADENLEIEMGMQQDMQAMRIQDSAVESGGDGMGEDDSDVDMQMIS